MKVIKAKWKVQLCCVDLSSSFWFYYCAANQKQLETKFVEEMSWSRKIVLGCSLIGWEVWKTNKVSKRSTCGSVILDWLRPWETKKNMSKSFTYDWDWVILDWVRNLGNQHQDVKKWHWLFLKLSPLMETKIDLLGRVRYRCAFKLCP